MNNHYASEMKFVNWNEKHKPTEENWVEKQKKKIENEASSVSKKESYTPYITYAIQFAVHMVKSK